MIYHNKIVVTAIFSVLVIKVTTAPTV